MGRAPRYMHPMRFFAFILIEMTTNNQPVHTNLVEPIKNSIIKFAIDKRWEQENFINTPHILTWVIYHALGMTHDLPKVSKQHFLMEQVQIMHNIDIDEKEKKNICEKHQKKKVALPPPKNESHAPLDTM